MDQSLDLEFHSSTSFIELSTPQKKLVLLNNIKALVICKIKEASLTSRLKFSMHREYLYRTLLNITGAL